MSDHTNSDRADDIRDALLAFDDGLGKIKETLLLIAPIAGYDEQRLSLVGLVSIMHTRQADLQHRMGDVEVGDHPSTPFHTVQVEESTI